MSLGSYYNISNLNFEAFFDIMSDFDTAQKMKLRICSYLLKKSVIENFIFVQCEEEDILFFQLFVISTMKKKKKEKKNGYGNYFVNEKKKGH